MRKITFFLCLLSLILLISCSGEDDNSSESSNKLVGTWEEIEQYDYSSNETFPTESGEAIWVFTETRLTIHDEYELFNGQQIEYKYYPNTNEIVVMGLVRKITFPTNNEFLLNHSEDEASLFRRKN